MLRGYARRIGGVAEAGAQSARARLPQQRRRHLAGGREDRLDVRAQGHRGGDDQGAHRAYGLPYAARPRCADAADRGARERRDGFGRRDRHRLVAGSGPCGARRPAHLRQGIGADDAPAGLQQLPESHHGQILHPLGPLHPGDRLLVARREGGREERARFARARVPHARRPQGLRRRRHHARRTHRSRIHQPFRHDALCHGLRRRFRRPLLPRARDAADRSAHLHPHRRRLRALRAVHGRQGGQIRVGHAAGAQPDQGGGQGRPLRGVARGGDRGDRGRHPRRVTAMRRGLRSIRSRRTARCIAPSHCSTTGRSTPAFCTNRIPSENKPDSAWHAGR